MSGVSVTSASQILESFCNIWSQASQRKMPFSDFPACGPGMYMLWFNFILGLNFNFLCFTLITIHCHTPKQRKIKYKPRIKLNHNIYTIMRDTWSSCGGPLTWKAQIHDSSNQVNFGRNLPSSCFVVQYNSLISMIWLRFTTFTINANCICCKKGKDKI